MRKESALVNEKCPVWNASRRERYSPRGFLFLIEEGVFDSAIFTCTLCGKCEQNDVFTRPLRKEFMRAREKAVDRGNEILFLKQWCENLQRSGNIYGVE